MEGNNPLRFFVIGESGGVIHGRLTRGVLRKDAGVRFRPSRARATITKITIDGKEVKEAESGTNLELEYELDKESGRSPNIGDTMLLALDVLSARPDHAIRVRSKKYGAHVIHQWKGGGSSPECDPAIEDLFSLCEEGKLEYLENAFKSGRYAVNTSHPIELESLAHLAARSQHVEVLTRLIELKANVDARDRMGRTVLHRLVAEQKSSSEAAMVVFDLLIKAGANVNTISNESDFKRNPIIAAIMAENWMLASRLVDAKVDLSYVSKLHERPLSLGIETGPVDFLRKLTQAHTPDMLRKVINEAKEVARHMKRQDVLKMLEAEKIKTMSVKIENKAMVDEATAILKELMAHLQIQQFNKAKKGGRLTADVERKCEEARTFLAHNQKHRRAMDKSASSVTLDVASLRVALRKADKKSTGMMSKKQLLQHLVRCGMKKDAARTNVNDYFSINDPDKTGSVTWESFVEEYVRMQLAKAIMDVHGYFHTVDENGDGVLTMDEFRSGLVQLFGVVEAKRQALHLFQDIDKDGNGVIDLEEMKDWYKERARQIVQDRMMQQMLIKARKKPKAKFTVKSPKETFIEIVRACQFGRLGTLQGIARRMPKQDFQRLINKTYNTGRTPIFHTLWKEEYPTMVWLIERKANLQATNRRGNTLLHNACRKKDFYCVKLLVALGADHKVKNKVGRYPYQVVHDSEDMRKLKRTIIEAVRLRKNGGRVPKPKYKEMPEHLSKQYRVIFNFIDADKNGSISSSELMPFIGDDVDSTSIFTSFITDGRDDEISWPEFKKTIWNHIESIKYNKGRGEDEYEIN